jgi:hypothetical protein
VPPCCVVAAHAGRARAAGTAARTCTPPRDAGQRWQRVRTCDPDVGH